MSSRQSSSTGRHSVGRTSAAGQSGNRNSYSRSGRDYYTYGSAAADYDSYEEEEYRGRRDRNPSGRTEIRRAEGERSRQRLHPAGILSLVAAVIMMSAALFAYIGLQTQVTNAVEEIAELESSLSDLKSDNDEALNAIESGISLDDIKYRAITELGMTYAQEDQIIFYSNDDSDYVRQLIQP